MESAAALQVELAEQVPVSELEDVLAEVEDATTRGYELEPLDGIVRWRVALKAGEKKQVDLAFHVDVPESYEVGR